MNSKLKIIAELMEQLANDMDMTKEDLEGRMMPEGGMKKVVIESKGMDMDGEEMPEEMEEMAMKMPKKSYDYDADEDEEAEYLGEDEKLMRRMKKLG